MPLVIGAHKLSNTGSLSSRSSTSSSSEEQLQSAADKATVDIERNDSGLGKIFYLSRNIFLALLKLKVKLESTILKVCIV